MKRNVAARFVLFLTLSRMECLNHLENHLSSKYSFYRRLKYLLKLHRNVILRDHLKVYNLHWVVCLGRLIYQLVQHPTSCQECLLKGASCKQTQWLEKYKSVSVNQQLQKNYLLIVSNLKLSLKKCVLIVKRKKWTQKNNVMRREKIEYIFLRKKLKK